jgi:ribosomal protein S18 acetylase RimI-like enzyme
MAGETFTPFYPTKHHVQKIAGMLAHAFVNNMMYRVLIPDDAKRKASLPSLFEFIVGYALKHGTVIATSDALEGALLAIDWDKGAITTWRMLGSGALRLLFSIGFDFARRQSNNSKVLDEMHEALAPPSHVYLWIIGIDPEYQGKGLGSKLIRFLQSELAARHRPCYLETAKPENVGIYEHLGFRVVGRKELAVPGATATGMLWEG